MSKFFKRRRVTLSGLTGEFLSAKYFLIRAGVLVVLFLIVQLAGLREHTSFLSGTPAAPGLSVEESATLGVTYIVFYLGAVVIAPILALAAAMLTIWQRVTLSNDSTI